MSVSSWTIDRQAALARAPQQGSSRLGDALGELRCERVGLSPGLAVCQVQGRCDRALTFEAPGVDEPRVHFQYLAQGRCELLDAQAERGIAPAAPTLFRPPGGSVAWRAGVQAQLHVLSIDVGASALQRWCDSPLAQALVFDRRRPPLAVPERGTAVYARLRALLAAGGVRGPLWTLQVEALVLQALAEALAALGAEGRAEPALGRPASAADARRLRHVLELLHEAPAPPVTLLALAQAVGMPLRRLQRLYLARHGVALKDALQQARFEAARRALLQGELSIKQIAWQAGFAHATSFTHAFRARYGSAPSAWRGGGPA